MNEKVIQAIEEAIKEGKLENLYKEIRESEDISQTQARKFLEIARTIKEKESESKIKSEIIKALLMVEYQRKRKIIQNDFLYNLYKEVFKKAIEAINEKNKDEIKNNLFNIIQMITIKFYKEER